MNATFYYGGILLTMEPTGAEAMLVCDGKIAALGKTEVLRMQLPPGTEQIDLQGRTLMPAFIDAHGHLLAYADTIGLIRLDTATDFSAIAAALTAHKPEPGKWVIAFGYDHTSLAEGRHPDAAFLDALFPRNPVLLSHASGHMGVANSSALMQLGISRETANPPGGLIGRYPDGTCNGYLEETAFTLLQKHLPAPEPNERRQQFRRAQTAYLRYGITTAQEGIADQDSWETLAEYDRNGDLLLDVIAYADIRKPFLPGRANLRRLRYGGYKLFLDGSPQGKTAWLSEPYRGTDFCGYPIHSDEAVNAFVRRTMLEHQQLLTHCNGDAAAEQLLRAFTACKPDPALRPVMVHAQLVRPDQLQRMPVFGMLPSFFPSHTYYWGDVHLKNLGNRAAVISPAQTAKSYHIPFTLHMDTPVLPPNPLDAVWSAVNRTTRDGICLGAAQRISTADALRAVTLHAAYQYHEERSKGSLRVGKRADLILLDQNPITVQPSALRKIRVLETIKDGVPVYQAQLSCH